MVVMLVFMVMVVMMMVVMMILYLGQVEERLVVRRERMEQYCKTHNSKGQRWEEGHCWFIRETSTGP